MKQKIQKTGVFNRFLVSNGGLGQNYTTIDGVEYVGFLDVTTKGFPVVGDMVEYIFSDGPTVLRDSPRITESRPCVHSMCKVDLLVPNRLHLAATPT